MDILEMGASLLADKLGTSLDAGGIAEALSGLLGGADGQIDLAGLVGKMSANADLGSLVSSWLGDGANDAFSPEGVMALFGDEGIAGFASKLGIDSSAAASGLADVLPEMVDKASSGGSLLEMAGGASGLLGAAKSFFK
ncbi:MAG: YidB family protein [Pseudomonadota bacterium]